MQFTSHGVPRRSFVELLTKEEQELADLMKAIEELGAHPLLTDCIDSLEVARMRLADWVELQQPQEPST